MKVILNQDVIGLGEEGDIKDVADGYARNFLLPKKLVVPHTKEFLAALEHKRVSIEKRKEEKRLEAAGLKEQPGGGRDPLQRPRGRKRKALRLGEQHQRRRGAGEERLHHREEAHRDPRARHPHRRDLQDPHPPVRQGRSHHQAGRGRSRAARLVPAASKPRAPRARKPEAAPAERRTGSSRC